ncbi:hypothetical protein RCS94_06420 [Orbaceae bacterium ac157xtp]
MRYFIIFIISIVFFIASAFSISFIVEFLYRPSSLYVQESYLTLPTAAGILISTATLYPTLCGFILSGCKLFDALVNAVRGKRKIADK